MAEIGYARPVADLDAGGTPVGAATRWEAMDEVTLNTADYVSLSNYGTFSVQFGGFELPAGGIITQVRAVVRKDSGYPGSVTLGRVAEGDWGAVAISWGYTTWGAYHYSAWMPTNPFTSALWTAADIANTKARYYQSASSGKFEQSYLEIEYTMGSGKRNQAILVM